MDNPITFLARSSELLNAMITQRDLDKFLV